MEIRYPQNTSFTILRAGNKCDPRAAIGSEIPAGHRQAYFRSVKWNKFTEFTKYSCAQARLMVIYVKQVPIIKILKQITGEKYGRRRITQITAQRRI